MNKLIPQKKYRVFLNKVIIAIKNSQYKASQAVNRHLVELYWAIGKLLHDKIENETFRQIELLQEKLAKAEEEKEKLKLQAEHQKRREALQINPKYAEAYYHIGIAHAKKGDLDKAIELYEKAIQINPKFTLAYLHMGIAYTEKGNFDKAIELFDKAIQINPEYALAYLNMGVAYSKKGNPGKAIEMHKKAIQINPELADDYRK